MQIIIPKRLAAEMDAVLSVGDLLVGIELSKGVELPEPLKFFIQWNLSISTNPLSQEH